MIGSLVRYKVRARPASPEGRLAYGGYMELSWDPSRPWEVRLAEAGPDGGEVVFARDLMLQAMSGEPAGEGVVRLRLRHYTGSTRAHLGLVVATDEGPLEFALCDTTAAEFLNATTDLVPAGDEDQYADVDAGLAELLGEAA